MNKKELDNLILNEIFGFGREKEEEASMPGIISRGSPIRDEEISKAAHGDKETLGTLLQIKKNNPKRLRRYAKFVEKPDMRLLRFEKAIDAKREGTLSFTTQIQTLTKIRNKLHSVEEVERLKTNAKLDKDYDFYNMLEVYKQLFLDDQSPEAVEPGAEAPRRDGEVTPVSGDIEEVPAGELRPVSGEIEEAPPAPKQAGASLQINPKMLSDREYVSRFAELVKKYMLLEPKTEDESRRQVSKILDLKKQMNDLMKQGTPGARELQLAIRGELAPVQRKIQQVAENLVKQNFEQIIREELENYIKEKK